MMTEDPTEIRALVSLLSDEDPKILAIVWDHLLQMGHDAVPFLKEAAETRDPRLRLRARHILGRIVLDELERDFQALAAASDDDFDLERACHVLARIEYPDLEPARISQPLEEIAERIRPRLQGILPPLERIRAINRVLFEELRFSGNALDFHDIENAFLNCVLERRIGIPITLAAVYLLVTRRLGLHLRGVGLPNHFLVKHGEGADEVFLDPFLGGKILTRKDCIQYLTSAGYYFKDAYISESTSRDLVIRMLRHLVVVYSKHQDKNRVRRLTHYVEILQTRERAR